MKKRAKKLSLNKESIRSLTAAELDHRIVGAAPLSIECGPKIGDGASSRDRINKSFFGC